MAAESRLAAGQTESLFLQELVVQSFPSPGLQTEGLICRLQQSGNKMLLQAGCALLSSRWIIPCGCTSPGCWEHPRDSRARTAHLCSAPVQPQHLSAPCN